MCDGDTDILYGLRWHWQSDLRALPWQRYLALLRLRREWSI